MIVVACALGAVFGFAGLGVSYASNLPSGATIILLAGMGYLISLAIARLVHRKMLRRSAR
jgi:zinc transport system permease protein